MYISLAQSSLLDQTVKNFEVAFRSFISETLINSFPTSTELADALGKIAFPKESILSRKFEAKIKSLLKTVVELHSATEKCKASISSREYDNNVPYVSEIMDILLIFFNDIFSHANISKGFSTIEEFHYCCALYHTVRNNLSHPASRPVTESDAAKVIYFVTSLLDELDDRFFWFADKAKLLKSIDEYQQVSFGFVLKAENLNAVIYSYKQLLCRDTEISKLYSAIIGDGERMRLAGSVALYGYGGVGKTAITTEFLLRLIRDKKDGKHKDIEFVLFFSSKDEFLRSSDSTGELYIDEASPQFETLEELKKLICINLSIESIESINKYTRGIIVIDNIENIEENEKSAIIAFIKSLPRTVQFIITSRSEELCEEKIHVEEFSDNTTGIQFILDLVESEGFNLVLTPQMTRKILDVSKGNALIIRHILNNLSQELVSFGEITASLETLKSKSSDMIASFMYKNTFDRALLDLKAKGYPAIKVIQVISLYDERIELYSISKLADIEISSADALCNLLLERLVLVKMGEYYELNEFAKRFVFIKLLPDKINLGEIQNKIRIHKQRMTEKLGVLDQTLAKKKPLQRIVNEWQPRNYIDKIVIAELFSLYNEALVSARNKNLREFRRCFDDLQEHSIITNHPYVAFQKARLLKLELHEFSPKDQDIYQKIEAAYEEALESIEFDYRYLLHTPAHSSLLMLFGIFLVAERNEHNRAIRYLEDARKGADKQISKIWFICRNYLTISYKHVYEQTETLAYKNQLKQIYKEVLGKASSAHTYSFDIGRFKREFSQYL